LLALNFVASSSDYLLGIDIGGTAIKAAAFSCEGKPLSTRTEPTLDGRLKDGRPAWAVAVRQLVADFAGELAAPARHIGLSAPGLAAADQRSIASLPNRLAGIEGFDWADWLGQRVLVLNDAHAALLGEVWQGAALACRNVVMLTLGTGVGGAAMVDGALLRGHFGRAGHLGHVTVDYSGKTASIFGMPGALEVAIGNYNVGERSGGRFADSSDLLKAAGEGDGAAQAVWEQSVQALGCAIGSFINAFDPEVVVLGGGVAGAGEALWLPLKRVLAKVEWRPFGEGVPVVPAKLGGWAGTFGAAWEAMRAASGAAACR